MDASVQTREEFASAKYRKITGLDCAGGLDEDWSFLPEDRQSP
jgi:hypothetical protein